jgi:tRNA 2-thiouridine synthesizing protein A
MSTVELDARWLLCPLPVIRTQQRLKNLAPGEILRVICTDPGALHDIPAWCRIHGHQVLQTQQQDKEVIITLQVGKP